MRNRGEAFWSETCSGVEGRSAVASISSEVAARGGEQSCWNESIDKSNFGGESSVACFLVCLLSETLENSRSAYHKKFGWFQVKSFSSSCLSFRLVASRQGDQRENPYSLWSY